MRRAAGSVASIIASACATWLAASTPLSAREAHQEAHAVQEAARNRAGRLVYEDVCAACHGVNGAGAPQTLIGFAPPDTFPDFSQCDQSAPEYTRDWRAIIVNGGTARGYSEIMPAFGDALTAEQISAVIAYLRGLCTNPTWAPGELNVPRALVTEKAFPEDEVVWTTSVEAKGAPAVENTLVYEWQFSARNQLEIEAPFDFARPNGEVESGIGDVTAGVKHVLFFDFDPLADAGSILSLQGEIVLPTGSPSRGLGTGEPQVGAFVAYDLLLPHAGFLQVQAGGDVPRHTDRVPSDVYLNLALGRSFATGMGLGRLWSPMVELTASRDLERRARTDFDVIPQLQVTLSARQHVVAALGYRIAVNDSRDRPSVFMLYVLWDWLDGQLTAGW